MSGEETPGKDLNDFVLDVETPCPDPGHDCHIFLFLFGIDSGLVGSTDGRGAARAEDAQRTPTQSQISSSIPVYEEKC